MIAQWPLLLCLYHWGWFQILMNKSGKLISFSTYWIWSCWNHPPPPPQDKGSKTKLEKVSKKQSVSFQNCTLHHFIPIPTIFIVTNYNNDFHSKFLFCHIRVFFFKLFIEDVTPTPTPTLPFLRFLGLWVPPRRHSQCF